jgi:hypothetical protein
MEAFEWKVMHCGTTSLRIPMMSATYSNRKSATDSDLKPAGVPI